MKTNEVTGSSSALANLFSGGYAMQVRNAPTPEQRAKRRAALAGRWSAIMAQVAHPVAALKKAWRNTVIARPDAVPPSWQGFRRKHRDKPVAFKPVPDLAALVSVIVERSGDSKADRRTAKRLVRRAGHSWQSANRQLREGRRELASFRGKP